MEKASLKSANVPSSETETDILTSESLSLWQVFDLYDLQGFLVLRIASSFYDPHYISICSFLTWVDVQINRTCIFFCTVVSYYEGSLYVIWVFVPSVSHVPELDYFPHLWDVK